MIQEGGRFWMELGFRDGSQRVLEMTRRKHERGFRYEQKGSNPHGEFYIVTHNKDLEVYDREGLINVCRRIL